MVGSVYHIFDVMIYNGNSITKEPSVKRLKNIDSICIDINSQIGRIFVSKRQIIFKTFEEFVSCHFRMIKILKSTKSDGIIYTQLGSYFNRVFRWKPINTVDFLFSEGFLKVLDKKLIDSGMKLINSSSFPIDEDSIIECSIDGEKAKYIRSRKDKKFPNPLNVLERIKKSHISRENLIKSFLGLTTYFMRAYHNSTKRELLGDSGGILLDIGSGAGGDLQKWKNFREIICVDPSEENISELKRRIPSYLDGKVKIFIKKFEDFTEFDENSVDIISCFFCMNLIGIGSIKRIVNTIGKMSKNNSRFVCILMSRKYTKQFFEKIGKNKFQCNKYSIKDLGNSVEISINDTIVSNQVEDLINETEIISELTKIGFSLEYKRRLNKNNFMSLEERLLSSLYVCFSMIRK